MSVYTEAAMLDHLHSRYRHHYGNAPRYVRALAEAEHRSLNAEIVHLLEGATHP